MDKFISVQRAAEILDLSEASIYKLIVSGKIRVHSLGMKKGYRIAMSEIDRHIRESVIQP